MWWGNRVLAELEPEIFNSTWPETALGRVRHTKRVLPASISSLIHLCSSCPNCVSKMCGVRAWVAWLVRFAQQQGHQVGLNRGSRLTYLEIPKQGLKNYVQGKFLCFRQPLNEICMQNPWSSLLTAKSSLSAWGSTSVPTHVPTLIPTSYCMTTDYWLLTTTQLAMNSN